MMVLCKSEGLSVEVVDTFLKNGRERKEVKRSQGGRVRDNS